MKNKKVSFHCSWGESCSELFDRYSLQTPQNKGKWNTIEGTPKPFEADYHIIMQDDDGESLKLNPLKKIYLKREPPWTVRYSFEKKPALYKFDYTISYQASVWWVKRTYDELLDLKDFVKDKKICCIVSGKNDCKGHDLRIKFTKELAKSDIDIDIYGKFWDGQNLGEKYKGTCSDKFEVLSKYEYSIAMENGKMDNYFSEKFADSVLSGCKTIYWGCNNIGSFFNEKTFKTIDITNIDGSIDKIKDLIKSEPSDDDKKEIQKGRLKILNEYNLWAVVEKIIKTGRVL